jgi:DNA-binding PadR family transcriptional regulator
MAPARARRLSTQATLILAAVSRTARHGYAIRKEIAARTGDEVRLGITTLYRLLKQLLDEGLLAEMRTRPAPELDDERRRYYRVTPAGRRALSAEVRRLERVLSAVRGAARQKPRA